MNLVVDTKMRLFYIIVPGHALIKCSTTMFLHYRYRNAMANQRGGNAFPLKTSGAPRTVGDSRTGPCNPDPTRVTRPYFA